MWALRLAYLPRARVAGMAIKFTATSTDCGMNASNRGPLLNKTFRVLKKHYKAVTPPADRSVLEHMLYGCCLENSKHEQADEVIAFLQQNFFDWNEVRVTTAAELTEVMAPLEDPAASATRLKRTLHSVFETHYTFELEFLKKQNLGKATKEIEDLSGATSFLVSYVTQNALGGHSIPVNRGAFAALVVLGVATESDVEKQRVPGLERTIPKTKGVEFGSLLHQLGVDYAKSPFSPKLRTILLEIAPDAKDRLPKRSTKKKEEESEKPEKGSKSKAAAKSEKKATKKTSKKKSADTKASGTKKKKSATKSLSRKKPR